MGQVCVDHARSDAMEASRQAVHRACCLLPSEVMVAYRQASCFTLCQTPLPTAQGLLISSLAASIKAGKE
jgi:hypothetical protein